MKHKLVQTKLFFTAVDLLHLPFYEIIQNGRKHNSWRGALTSDCRESPGTADAPDKA